LERPTLENENNEMLEMVATRYPEAYETCQKVCSFIESQYAYLVPDDEKLYLTIHLARITH